MRMKKKYFKKYLSPSGFQAFQCSRRKLLSCTVDCSGETVPTKKKLALRAKSAKAKESVYTLWSVYLGCTMSDAILSVIAKLTLIATGIGVCFASPGKPF